MYTITSRYYDGSYRAKKLADLPFYLGLAREHGGPVLELGCGTGRVTLPIAREGIEVTGVDLSEPMLGVLLDKLAASEPEEVRHRVTVRPGDMRTLRMEPKFRLVLIPFRAMQHMHAVEDQIAALSSARDLLAPGGLLAFDVFFPKFDRILAGIGQEMEEMAWETTELGNVLTIRRSFIKDAADLLSLTFSGRFIFRTFNGEVLVREESESLRMTCYTYSQLQLLFRLTGLESAAEYGTFDKRPLASDSPEMIFVLRKKQ